MKPPRTRNLATAPLALAAALCLADGPTSHATPQSSGLPGAARVQLLLRDGRWIDGRIETLDASSCQISPSDGGVHAKPTEITRGTIVACLVGSDQRRSTEFLTQLGNGTLVFNDGQLLPGTLRTDARPPRWEHRWVGAIPIKTDVLSEIRLVATRRAPARTDADTILYMNGDIATGFVESIGYEIALEPIGSAADALEPSPEPAGTEDPAKPMTPPQPVRRIQTDRVAAIAFAALGEPPANDPLVWTTDGSIVRAKDIAFQTESGWRFLLADPEFGPRDEAKPITSAITRPSAILFDRSAMTPLVACGQPEYRPTESSYRYETRPQVRIESPDQSLLGLGSVELDGPLQARFALPASMIESGGAVSFSADLALVEPVPLDARTSVTVRFSGTSGETIVLDSTNRRASVRVLQALAADSALEIVIDDGGNGIAGDRIVIHRGCFVRQP